MLVSDPVVDVMVQFGMRIPLSDGTQLSAVYYAPTAPAQSGPRPVIVSITPYVAQSLHDYALYYSRNGFPFLAVDIRGRGNSQGSFAANGSEARDAREVVEWAASQPFCNGKVLMWGGSYAGFIQWGAAAEKSPGLVAMVPVASPFRGVDSPAPGNIFLPYRIQWLNLIADRTSQEKIFADQQFWSNCFRRWFESGKPFREIDSLLGMPSDTFHEWLDHPCPDGYWDSYNPSSEQYARIDIPVLTITGIYDVNQAGALHHYRQHLAHCSPDARARHFLVIGPWDHAGTRIPKRDFAGLTVREAAMLDLGELHRQWYAWALGDGAKPAFLEKPVAYYVMGADVWRYADTFDAVTVRREALYLRSVANPVDVYVSGTMVAEEPDKSGPDHYRYDPRATGHAALESIVDPTDVTDQRMVHAMAGNHLVYHSRPFETATEISGFFRLSVWLAIDQPDTDFRATVYEIALDGSSVLLARDVLRARYREDLRRATLITTTAPLRYDFQGFGFTARQVAKGSRLRLVIGPINSIHSEKNFNAGGTVADESMADARTVTVRLFHDPDHPSMLEVPFGPGAGADM